MAVSYNRVILGGNLTRDPELRFTNNGVPVCGFGLAVNYRKADGTEDVDFFDINVWREQGEAVANYKKKGDPILIEGRLKFNSWEAQDGSKRNKVDVTADMVQFLPGGNGSGADQGAEAGAGQNAAPANQTEEDFDDIPF